jgi:hypothetical protein
MLSGFGYDLWVADLPGNGPDFCSSEGCFKGVSDIVTLYQIPLKQRHKLAKYANHKSPQMLFWQTAHSTDHKRRSTSSFAAY